MIRLVRVADREPRTARGPLLWSQRLQVPLERGGRARRSPPLVSLDEVALSGSELEPDGEDGFTECVTYVCEGGLESTASLKPLMAGDFHYRARRPSGRSRLTFSRAGARGARLFRLWVQGADAQQLRPSSSRRVGAADRRGSLCLVASQEGERSALRLQQDVSLFSSTLEEGTHIAHALGEDRFAWLYVIEGRVLLNNIRLSAGDAASVDEMLGISLLASSPAELLLVDMTVGIAPPMLS
jgi:hypothetical protein